MQFRKIITFNPDEITCIYMDRKSTGKDKEASYAYLSSECFLYKILGRHQLFLRGCTDKLCL